MLRLIIYGTVTALGAAVLAETGDWPVSEAVLAEAAEAPSRLDRALLPFATLPGLGPLIQGLALLAIAVLPFALSVKAGREIVLAPTWMRLFWVFGVVTYFFMLPWQVLSAAAIAFAGYASLQFGLHHGPAGLTGAAPGFLPVQIIAAILAASILGGLSLGKRHGERALAEGRAARRTTQDWITGSEARLPEAPGRLWRAEADPGQRWSEALRDDRVAARRAAIDAHETAGKAPGRPSAAMPTQTPPAATPPDHAPSNAGGVVQDMRAKKRTQSTITRA